MRGVTSRRLAEPVRQVIGQGTKTKVTDAFPQSCYYPLVVILWVFLLSDTNAYIYLYIMCVCVFLVFFFNRKDLNKLIL